MTSARCSKAYSTCLFAIFAVLFYASTAIAATATASWSANPEPDIAGYKLSYGTQSLVYTDSVTVVGNVTTTSVPNLLPGVRYYFVVQAYNTSGVYSGYSAEFPFDVPGVATPNITGLSPSTGPAGTIVTITGTGFGTVTGSVTFGGAASAATAWAPGSVTVAVPAGAPAGSVNVILTAGGVNSNPFAFTVTTANTGLPAGWASTDIGSPASTGSASYNAGTYTLTGGGTDVFFASDQFRYAYQQVNGDFDVTARVVSLAAADAWAKAGVMVRSSLADTAQNAFTQMSKGNGYRFTRRVDAAGATTSSGAGNAAAAPYWVRLQRRGSQITGSTSSNGTTWTTVDTATVNNLPATVSVGLAVCAHLSSGTATAVFDNFSIQPFVPLPPTLSSLSPTSGAAGAAVTIAGTNFGATRGSSTVTFNGTQATPTTWSSTSIVVPVPSGATSGNVVVTVNSLASNGLPFTVIPTPTISLVSPGSGFVGTSVAITGSNFGASQGSSTISFNGAPATPTTWSATSIVVPVPAGATTGSIVITVNGIPSAGAAFQLLSAGTLVHDTFSATNGTNLDLKMPEVSTLAAPWRVWGVPGMDVQNGRARTTGSGADWEAATVDAGAADVNVTADTVVSNIAAPFGGIVVRATDANNYFFARYYGSGLGLYRRQNGQIAALGNTTVSALSGTMHQLGVSAVGNTLTVTWDGVVKLAASDAFNKTATKHGLSWAPFVDTLTVYDNFDIAPATPAANRAPTLTPPGNQTTVSGGTVSLQLSATDPDGDALTFSATGLPGGLSINSSGRISGTVTAGASSFTVVATASDATLSDSKTFTWTITTSTPPPTGTLVHDSFTAADGTNANLRMPEVSNIAAPWRLWGTPGIEIRGNRLRTTGSGPDWEAATVDAGASDVLMTVDAAVSTTAGPFGGVVFRATDANNYFFARFYGSDLGLYRRQNGTITPLGNMAVTAPAGTTHRLGVTLSGSAIAVAWDGATVLSRSDAFNSGATQHGVLWAPFVDTLSAYDNFDIVSTTPGVNRAPTLTSPGNQSNASGATVSLQLSASDPDGNTLTYGATGLPTGLNVNTTTGRISGTITASAGTSTVTVSVSDGSLSDSKTFTWTVTAPTGSVTLVSDAFTAVDGTNADFRMPDVSTLAAPWRVWGTPGLELRGNQFRAMSGGTDWEAATVDAGAANVVVSSDVAVSNIAAPYGGLVVRATDANNYFFARFYGNSLGLYRRQGGVITPLGAIAVTATPGTTHRIGLSASGNTLTVTWDGTAMLNATDAFNQTATKHGLSWAPFVDALTAYDNFRITTP